MLTSHPEVSWRRFLDGLTPEDQTALEVTLSEAGLSLGEFMEIVERAYLDAFFLRPSVDRDICLEIDAEPQTALGGLLASYARRKRMFSQIRAGSEGLVPGTANENAKLRRHIHASFERLRRTPG